MGMFWGEVGREVLNWVGLKELLGGAWVVLLLNISGFAEAVEKTLVMVVMESGFVGSFMVSNSMCLESILFQG